MQVPDARKGPGGAFRPAGRTTTTSSLQNKLGHCISHDNNPHAHCLERIHGVAPGRSAMSSALVSSPRFGRAPVSACQRHEQQAQVQKTILKILTFFCRAFRHGWQRSPGITFPPRIEIACMCCCSCMCHMPGCGTAPVHTTSRLQVLHHWRVPQRKEGSWCNVRTRRSCASAREGRSVRFTRFRQCC